MMTKEIMKQTLEAIKRSDSFLNNWHENYSDDEADHYSTVRLLNQNAIKALEEALKQEQSEPVAWCDPKEVWQLKNGRGYFIVMPEKNRVYSKPLYEYPQPKIDV